MKAWQVIHQGPIENNPLERAERDIPEPGPNQVLLKVEACGLCHTDIHIAEGDIIPPRLPIVPGHQVVGRVVTIGSTISSTKFTSGQRVGVPWLQTVCGSCPECLSGKTNLCQQATFTGFHTNGGFAEYMVADEQSLLPLSETICPELLAPLLCAGMVGFRAIKRAQVYAGCKVGLFGFGASAHLVLQVLNKMGCEVLVFTRSAEHQNHAIELGATWAGRPTDIARSQVESAIIFTPNGASVEHALRVLRPGGTLAINAIHTSDIPSLPYKALYQERTLTTVTNSTHQDGLEFIKFAIENQIKSTVQAIGFEDLNRALVDLKHSRINGEAVLVF